MPKSSNIPSGLYFVASSYYNGFKGVFVQLKAVKTVMYGISNFAIFTKFHLYSNFVHSYSKKKLYSVFFHLYATILFIFSIFIFTYNIYIHSINFIKSYFYSIFVLLKCNYYNLYMAYRFSFICYNRI